LGKLADLVLWKPAFFGAKPSLILKGGMIAAAAMGDPNASIPTPQPVHYRPMFGSFGKAVKTSITFVSKAGLKNPDVQKLKLSKTLVEVKNVRKVGKKHMIHNSWQPKVTVDPETYEVRADGELLVCEPAKVLPNGPKVFSLLMLEIKSKLKIPRSAYKVEVRGQLRLPFESRQKSRLKTKLESGEEVGLILPRGEILRGGDLVTGIRRPGDRNRRGTGKGAAHRDEGPCPRGVPPWGTGMCPCRWAKGSCALPRITCLRRW
jgi:hypothetical protein